MDRTFLQVTHKIHKPLGLAHPVKQTALFLKRAMENGSGPHLLILNLEYMLLLFERADQSDREK